jgi:Ca2+-transporting ATPase
MLKGQLGYGWLALFRNLDNQERRLAHLGSVASFTPVHVLPGRVRFRVHSLYRRPALKHPIERDLLSHPEIRRASANPLTGSVLVEFDVATDPGRIAALLEKAIAYRQGAANFGSGSAPGVSRGNYQGSTLPDRRYDLLNSLIGSTENSWHLRGALDVIKCFDSSEKGLTERNARDRLDAFGPNRLPELRQRSCWAILRDQFDSMPTVLLLAAAGISLFTGGLSDAIAIGGVLAINAALGFFTESQSESLIGSLRHFVQPTARVVRDAKLQHIPSEQIVPGDIIVLEPGTYVCADARIIEAEQLTVDESALTGESLPVAKSVQVLDNPSLALGERRNMVYLGTRVTGGSGLAIVVATGAQTELGLIHRLAGETKPPETPMERQLARLGRQLVFICSGICTVILAIGLFQGYGLVQMLETAISLAVASVPEGLPVVAATTLALGIVKMRRHGVIIRKLEAVETLGCVKTLCLDKTGTLTLNRMKVQLVCCGEQQFDPFSRGSSKERNSRSLDHAFRKLAEIGVLCSETTIERSAGTHKVSGSSTENALIELALEAGIDPIALRAQYPTVRVIRRAERRNYMCTIHQVKRNLANMFEGPLLVAVKGSPSEVLALCRWQIRNNKLVPITEADRRRILSENDQMAAAALRVLGVAYQEMKTMPECDQIERDLIWLGMVAMADPIRKGVREAIQAFHRAGIDTVMITGDQPLTASAIGAKLELSRNGQLRVREVSGPADLEQIEAPDISYGAQVFARVSPADKLQIVQALQRGGKVVAMTGDGINDAPALKAADIGIAMGSTGTDAARDVADIVLENDDLQTMLVAIGEGRSIYSNIRKSLHFLLSTNFSEIIVVFIALATGLGHPLNAMQLLWINLISDILPGMALALEPPEPDVMSAPPRDPNEPVMKNSDLGRIVAESAALSGGALAVYGYGLAKYGAGARTSTLVFTSLTSGQLLHAVSCRSATHSVLGGDYLPSNHYLTCALLLSYGLQALTLLMPGLRKILGLTPISADDALIVGAGAILPFFATEGAKLLIFNDGLNLLQKPQRGNVVVPERPSPSAVRVAKGLIGDGPLIRQ